MVKSTKQIIEDSIARVNGSNASTAKKSSIVMKHAITLLDTFSGVREPIMRQAENEQRNDAWRKTAVSNAYGSKLRELTRLQHEVKNLRAAHEETKPRISALDRSDMLAVLETVELAKRVAAIPATHHHKLSVAEKLAAIRAPSLSNITPTQSEIWTRDYLGATEPESLNAYAAADQVLEDAESALSMVKQSLQQVSGFVDSDSQMPGLTWSKFEHEQLASLREELANADAEAANRRRAQAMAKNTAALAEAVNNLSHADRRVFIDKALEMQVRTVGQ